MRLSRTSLRLATAAVIVGTGLLAIATVTRAQGPLLTRGPYLQMGTPTSIVVRWRTAAAADSVVRYGTEPGEPTSTVSLSAITTEHAVTLAQLTPHTRYFYAVGSSGAMLAGGGLDHTFTTAPAPGSRTATRLWVLGDSGTADVNARAVRDAYLAADRTRGTDLWLMLGDNAYTTGTDAQYQAAVFDTYPEMLRQAVLWPTFGNHDALSADSATQSGPYYNLFTLPTQGEAGGLPSATEAYYSFDYGTIHIVCLDSTESDRSPTGPMLTWLAQDLAASHADWTIAFFHHAPYSKGSHDSDTERELVEMRQHAVPLLEAGGVDLVLSGHSHSYERSVLLNGHVGISSTLTPGQILDGSSGREPVSGAYRKRPGIGPGAVYVTAGSSGQVTLAALNHPAMATSQAVLGSLVVDVDGPRLDVTFLGANGQTHDAFTLSKHTVAAPIPPRAVTATVTQAAGPLLTLDWQAGMGGGAPDAFVLEAGSRAGAADLGRLATGSRATQFQTPVMPGRYFLRARASNAVGVSAPSEEVEVVVDAQGGWAPAAPTLLTSTVSGGTVALTWQAGPGTASFQVEAGRREGAVDVGALATTATSFTATTVPPGAYFVRVRGRGPTGLAGPPSREALLVVGGAPAAPAAPEALRASVAEDRLVLVWAPPRGGPAPLSYVVEAGASPVRFTLGRIRTTTASPGLTRAGVPPGTYYVRVRGENGQGEGLPSSTVRIDVP